MLAVPVQAQAMADSEVYALAEEIGGAYGICPELLQAIAWHESRYEENASNGGCEGAYAGIGKMAPGQDEGAGCHRSV